MSFCIAMKVKDGLVAMADTRLTSGVERSSARKVTIRQHERHSLFLMTSGLRSVRDKALTYFEDELDLDAPHDRLYKAANAFGEQVRRVAREDKEALKEAGLAFNLFTIVGGQLENDKEHRLYLIYPQGNWVEMAEGTPYYLIGESSYGKSLLDRALNFDTSMGEALKIGYLAFNATRAAANDVDYPIDIALYKKNSFKIIESRYEEKDLLGAGTWWHERLLASIKEMPDEWMKHALDRLPK